MYEDARYTREEVPLLLEECEQAKAQASQHPGGIRALRKLIFACTEAIKAEGPLVLACD